jgi:sugar (pentulose or hexulose) kinase
MVPQIKLTGKESLGIDAGTQGLDIMLYCPERRLIIAVGHADYQSDYLLGEIPGRILQQPSWWTDSMHLAMQDLRKKIYQQAGLDIKSVSGIGITGHMHASVFQTTAGERPYPASMWNDGIGEKESDILTELFETERIPARFTLCKALFHHNILNKVAQFGPPSTSLAYDLSGEWVIGPGEFSGMVGVIGDDGKMGADKLEALNKHFRNLGITRAFENYLPNVVRAGEVAATLSKSGSDLLGGLPVGTPIAAPEGDQQSALVSSGARTGDRCIAVSAGTSLTCNFPSARSFTPSNETVNVLAGPESQPMIMVCVRNGTEPFGDYVKSLIGKRGQTFPEVADYLTVKAENIPANCYGALLLPFFRGENVARLPHSKELWLGINDVLGQNEGLRARLLLEGPCMTLRYGLEWLANQNVDQINEVILSGGVLKSRGQFAAQVYANVLNMPVITREGDTEGTAKGAALLAAYMTAKQNGYTDSLADFVQGQMTSVAHVSEPNTELQAVFDERFGRFSRAVELLQEGTSHEEVQRLCA